MCDLNDLSDPILHSTLTTARPPVLPAAAAFSCDGKWNIICTPNKARVQALVAIRYEIQLMIALSEIRTKLKYEYSCQNMPSQPAAHPSEREQAVAEYVPGHAVSWPFPSSPPAPQGLVAYRSHVHSASQPAGMPPPAHFSALCMSLNDLETPREPVVTRSTS